VRYLPRLAVLVGVIAVGLACVPAGLVNATALASARLLSHDRDSGLTIGDIGVAIDPLRDSVGPLYDRALSRSRRGRLWLGAYNLIVHNDISAALQLWEPVAADAVFHAFSQEQALTALGIDPYNIAVELGASQGSAECLHGRAFLAQSELDVAAQHFEAALRRGEFDPRLAERDGCYWDAARAYILRKDWPSAARVLEEGLASCSDCWTGYYLLGRVYAEYDTDYEKAVVYFLYAHEQNPGWLGIYVPLVETLMRAGRIEDAKYWAVQGLERSDNPALQDLFAQIGQK